ncbi:hypothetical protein EQ500_10715, partial [Lactobacillus sp. XV13L]|nr:hypothetical protein [Lactobacillus sp. XV13L]
MFDLIINLGTKEFLRSYINQNSLFAYNIQHHQDYVLLQFNQSPQLQAASCWKLIKQAPHLPIMKKEFYLIYLNLNLDNQKLLISQQSRLPSQASLYQRTNYQQVLLLTA